MRARFPKGSRVLAAGVAFVAGLTGVRSATLAADVLYTAAPIRGVVVSAETGRPLAGASILVLWAGVPQLNAYLIVNTVRTAEAESHGDGTFLVPAWEATSLRVPITSDWPRMLCFASGHEPKWVDAKDVKDKKSVEIRLAPFRGRPAEWQKTIGEMLGWVAIAWVPLYGQPPPRMLSAVGAEWGRLPEGLRAGPPLSEAFEWTVREYRSAHEQQKLQ